jgi:hypothetical protein
MSAHALPICAPRPIDVSVHWKRGQGWLRAGRRPSILGDGLLERTRATSLALLGATAAVGLAIMALAFNQGWPLIAGSSIPRIQPRHQSIADAAVVARAGHSGPLGAGARTHSSSRHRGGAGAPASVATGAGGASAPAASAPLVGSPSTPVAAQGPSPGSPAPRGHAPPTQPAQQLPATTVASPSPAPQAAPAPTPAPAPVAAPAPTPPEATASEAPPEESNLPPWSHGQGNAYGRSEDRHDPGGGDDGD